MDGTKSHVKTMEHKSKIISAKRELLFQNLAALQCPFQELGRKSSLTLHKHMLDKPNKQGLITILYFLFSKLDDKRSHGLFKHVYPAYDRKQELEFQKICHSWWKECTKSNNDYKFPAVPSNLFMKAGGNDVIVFAFQFSTYVLYSCTNRLCAHDDFILLPPKSCQNPRIEAFQKVAHKAAVSGAMASFSRNAQLSRQEDIETKAQVDAMLARYRENLNRVKDLTRRKSMLMEQLKSTHVSSRGTPSKKCDIKTIENAIISDLKLVRKMWDRIFSSTDETSTGREIVRSILSQNEEGESKSAIKLGVEIPSLLIKNCNQEVSERVGPTLCQAEQLNLAGFIRLVNIMLQQILLKLHGGLPNFDSTVTVLKAHNIVHSRCSSDLARLQQDFDIKIPQVRNMNAQYREKVDCLNHQWNLTKETLIPGLPCPDLPSANTKCNLTDDLDIAITRPFDTPSNDLAELMRPTPRTYSAAKVTLQPVILPPTFGPFNHNISENEPEQCEHDTRHSVVVNDLTETYPDLDVFDSFSSLKQGRLLFGPSSPLKDYRTVDNVRVKCTQPKSPQQLNSIGKLSSLNHQPLIIDEAKPRKPAMDKLVDRVVDFTLHDTDDRPDASQCSENLIDMGGFDVGCQLDTLVFTSVDKVMRSPPRTPWSIPTD